MKILFFVLIKLMNISVKEFTPSLMNKDESSISTNCHVVINNLSSTDNLQGHNPPQPVNYPEIPHEGTTPAACPELDQHLAICFSKIWIF